jgi:hypothetical protein
LRRGPGSGAPVYLPWDRGRINIRTFTKVKRVGADRKGVVSVVDGWERGRSTCYGTGLHPIRPRAGKEVACAAGGAHNAVTKRS